MQFRLSEPNSEKRKISVLNLNRITPEAPHPEAAQASARKAAAQKRKATIAAKQNSKK